MGLGEKDVKWMVGKAVGKVRFFFSLNKKMYKERQPSSHQLTKKTKRLVGVTMSYPIRRAYMQKDKKETKRALDLP